MLKNLLVVTADANFGQVLLYGLEQAGYAAFIVKGKGEAVVRADEKDCNLAFLDMDLGYRSVLDIARGLRALRPDMSLVLFSDQELPAALDEIRPWTLLPKPYYLPDVLTMLNNNGSPLPNSVQSSSQTNHGRDVPPSNPALPWLQDVSKAAQHLTRLTLESSAQAALITRGEALWAYAGGLSQSAAKELAITVTRHWDGQKGSDLLRFVRLEATKAEHMLYATRIADDVVLALVFDAETPFSTIRTQAGQLAQSLSIPSAEEEKPVAQQSPLPAAFEAKTEFPEDEEDEQDVSIPNIADILSDVPPPRPTGGMIPLPEEDMTGTRPSSTRIGQYSRESSPAIRVDDLLVSNQDNEQTVEHVVTDLDATLPSKSQRRPETPIRRPMPGEFDETRPHSITEVAGRMMLEPVAPGLYNLTYACLLVPRFSSHYLTGDISDHLSEWLPQICIAFGWRLEYLAVRPEYIQWVVNVPPATSPGYLMRIMRQQTSEKVFTEFPRMKKENPSGDFWAPGYLIMGGTQPHPPQLVKDYIKQTRTRQGYSQPRNAPAR